MSSRSRSGGRRHSRRSRTCMRPQRIGLVHKSLPLRWERRSSGNWSATHSRSSGPQWIRTSRNSVSARGRKVVDVLARGVQWGVRVKSRPRQHQACRIAQGPLPPPHVNGGLQAPHEALGRIRRRLVRTRCRWIDRSWGRTRTDCRHSSSAPDTPRSSAVWRNHARLDRRSHQVPRRSWDASSLATSIRPVGATSWPNDIRRRSPRLRTC